MGNSLNYFIIHQLANSVGKHIPIYLIRHFRNNNLLPATLFSIHMAPASHNNPAPSRAETLFNTFHTKNDASRRKIRRFNKLHQFLYTYLPILYKGNTGIHRFTQIMGHHVGGHTHGNTRGSIYQQLRNPGWQYCRFLPGIIKIELKIYRFLINILQHGFRHFL